ncbi:hypothetical protein VTK56DRAFT_2093 [Thermocarpiscus australiensis]
MPELYTQVGHGVQCHHQHVQARKLVTRLSWRQRDLKPPAYSSDRQSGAVASSSFWRGPSQCARCRCHQRRRRRRRLFHPRPRFIAPTAGRLAVAELPGWSSLTPVQKEGFACWERTRIRFFLAGNWGHYSWVPVSIVCATEGGSQRSTTYPRANTRLMQYVGRPLGADRKLPTLGTVDKEDRKHLD